jgi:hypothetical protein
VTVREVTIWAGGRPILLVVLFLLPPIVVWLMRFLHPRDGGGKAPWRYVYSVLVYLACVPGMLAAVVTAYMLFFTRENLLDVNLLVYFLPVVSMVATLLLMRGSVSFDEVPGFDRLSGLMVMLAVSFGIALALQKTGIFLFFGASIQMLFALAAFVFLLLKWGTFKLFRRRGEARPQRPSFPSA